MASLIEAIDKKDPELLDQLAWKSKDNYLGKLQKEYGFSRHVLNEAWDLLVTIHRPSKVLALLRSFCIVFYTEGAPFSIERISIAMVQMSGSAKV